MSKEKQTTIASKTKRQPSPRTSTTKRVTQKSTSVASKLFCTNCGHELSNGEKFCPSCGTKAPQLRKAKPASNEQLDQGEIQTPVMEQPEAPNPPTEQSEVSATVLEQAKVPVEVPMQNASVPEQSAKKKRKREQVDYEALLMANMPMAVRQRIPIATLALVGVSILAAIIMLCATGSLSPAPEVYIRAGGEYRPLISDGQLWRLVTGSFLHVGIQHILFNMLCLFAFGRFLEKMAGHANMLCVYLLTACTGGLLSMAFHKDMVCVGASGAVFGVFGASISMVALLWRKYQINPKHMLGYMKNGLAFVGINFIYSLFPGVDMAGHIGGLLGGLVVGAVMTVPMLMDDKPFSKWFRRGFWGVSALVALILACTVVAGTNSHYYNDDSDSDDTDMDLPKIKGHNWQSSQALNPFAGHEKETEVIKLRSEAEQGDAEAQYKLACCYANGQGVAKNLTDAARWFLKSAEQGNANAQNEIGALYLNGIGVEKNNAEAVRWLRKAALRGHALAQNNLGVCYLNGYGVLKDEEEALRWVRKSANQGCALSQRLLGAFYIDGIVVSKDLSEARRWLSKAAAQGDTDAARLLSTYCTSNE